MRNARLDEAQARNKIARRNINNLRYANDTTLVAQGEEELKSLFMKVKEESEKAGLKLNIKKTEIMASGPITSWPIDRETMETVTDFIFLGSKITADGDWSHEIESNLLLGRKAVTNLNSVLKKQRHYFVTKVHLAKLWFLQWSCSDASLEQREGRSDSCLLPRLIIPQSLGITQKQPTRHWPPTPVSTATYGKCTHLLWEHQICNSLMNNHQQENVGGHQKNIPNIQGQRISPKKTMRGMKSCLEWNLILARDPQRAQTKHCAHQDPEMP